MLKAAQDSLIAGFPLPGHDRRIFEGKTPVSRYFHQNYLYEKIPFRNASHLHDHRHRLRAK
jgi:hypothetical protein